MLITHHRHDGADRVIAIAHTKKAGATEELVAGQALTRSAGGAISRIDTYRAGTGTTASFDAATGQFSGTAAHTSAYEYDGNARLTRENRTNAAGTTDTRYEYDAAGNRTKKTVTTQAGADITTYSYDSADRLTQESTSLAAGGNRVVSYTYDGNGNRASKAELGLVTLYRFDPQNRLIDIRTGTTQADAQAAAPSVSYAYDASGNRVKKGGSNASSYLIDSSYSHAQVVLETKGSDSTAYVRGLQLIRQTKVNGSTADDLFPLQGHLDTSLGAVDVDGNVVEQVDADAFGNLDQLTGLKQNHLYAGEYFDADGQLLYLRARWYDPRIGGFISGDPFEGRPRDPRTLNRYVYVHSDPVHYTDPTGTMDMLQVSIAPGATAGLAATGGAGAGMFLRNLALACAATAVVSTAFPSTSLPGPADLCTSNTMRVHLQVSTSPVPGRGTIHTTAPGVGVIQGVPVWGVTASMVRNKMLELFNDQPSWWLAGDSILRSLIIDVSQQVGRLVLAGGVPEYRPSAATAQLPHQRLYYRLDADNLRGWNLRR